MKTCSCPVASAIQEISTDACPYDIGQIQKVIFQRKESAAGVRNTIAATVTTIDLQATWTTLLAAVDGTKAQITGFVAKPELPPGAIKEYGSDNEVPNGIPVTVGRDFTPATFEMLSLSPVVAAELKGLECEDMQVFFINENNKIIAKLNDDSTHQGFDISGMFVSDREVGGFAQPDKVMLSFKLVPNWSDGLVIVDPESGFYPLTDLVN